MEKIFSGWKKSFWSTICRYTVNKCFHKYIHYLPKIRDIALGGVETEFEIHDKTDSSIYGSPSSVPLQRSNSRKDSTEQYIITIVVPDVNTKNIWVQKINEEIQKGINFQKNLFDPTPSNPDDDVL